MQEFVLIVSKSFDIRHFGKVIFLTLKNFKKIERKIFCQFFDKKRLLIFYLWYNKLYFKY